MLALSLFWLGATLIVATVLMVFWHSYRYRKIWALVSLITLLPLVIHIVLNWQSLAIRKAFYVGVLGLLSMAVGIAGGALARVDFLPDHEVVQVLEKKIAPPQQTPLPNQAKADAAAKAIEEDYDPLLTGSEYDRLNTNEIVPDSVNKSHPKARAEARYEQLSTKQRPLAKNKWVRLTMKGGKTIEGVLADVLDESVLIESIVSGGSVGLSYPEEQIESIYVRLEAGEELEDPSGSTLPASDEPAATGIIDGDGLQGQVNESDVPATDNRQAVSASDHETLTNEQDKVLQKIEQVMDGSKSLDKELGQ